MEWLSRSATSRISPHAPALVGVKDGIFAKALAAGGDSLAAPTTGTAGPAENTALLSGSIDLAFEGPSSALSAYTKSHGQVAIIAGVASGGAGLVVDKSITSVAELKGKKLGSPQLANTQDVALRYYLKTKGLTTTTTGGGDVSIIPSTSSSSAIVTAFETHQLDGAWMPEPYEQELVEAGGHVPVPESSRWPDGQWATTNLVVRKAFLPEHPQAVSAFLQGLLNTLKTTKADPSSAEQAANAQLAALQGGKPLKASVLDASWKSITFTDNPLASTMQAQVNHGVAVGLLSKPGDLASMYDLNALLAKSGQAKVAGL